MRKRTEDETRAVCTRSVSNALSVCKLYKRRLDDGELSIREYHRLVKEMTESVPLSAETIRQELYYLNMKEATFVDGTKVWLEKLDYAKGETLDNFFLVCSESSGYVSDETTDDLSDVVLTWRPNPNAIWGGI